MLGILLFTVSIDRMTLTSHASFILNIFFRNIESLPQGMSDALRQWFAMVTSNL